MDQNPILINFYKDLKYRDDPPRYIASLPWKSPAHKDSMVNNVRLARKRLDSLHERKLNIDPKLHDDYYKVISNYISEGKAEIIPNNEIENSRHVNYMPHRPVIKKASKSSRIRPVFDGSAKSHYKISLNDCLNTGPNLLPDLVEIFIRFRRWPIALTGDVSQAFLQIEMNISDRDAHRFLIYRDGQIEHCRFTRVPFGNTSSPFILNAVMRHHLNTFPDSEIKDDLKKNIYVDNYLSGADNQEEALNKFKSACQFCWYEPQQMNFQ